MRILIRLFLIFLAVLAAISFLRGALGGGARPEAPPGRRGGPKTRKLVRDPICGTYVAVAGSLTARRDSETFHFCSEACRDKFISSQASPTL